MLHKDYSLEAYQMLQYDERRERHLRYGTGDAYASEPRCVCKRVSKSVKLSPEQRYKELNEENVVWAWVD